MQFLVQLDSYRGPMDLLWYLIRKQELEISAISVARITQQYLDYLGLLEQLDVNLASDFIDLASQLIEMKSRHVLPRVEETDEEEDFVQDASEAIVEQLLEYKKYREAACLLDDRSREWQTMYPRAADDLPCRNVAPDEQPIREVELWDLVSALGRVMREQELERESSIVYDETPIQSYIQAIHDRLVDKGEVLITDILRWGMTKSEVIGLFLAILELVRHHSVEAEQQEGSFEIWVRPGPNFSRTLLLEDVDSYGDNNKGLAQQ
jgi:segregation and condensation protein A